jgi:hypothetical protein
MIKVASGSTGNWLIFDNMRGFSDTSSALLIPNLTNAEASGVYAFPNATGFTLQSTAAALNASGNTYIYLAIRRGPMKVPTSGTSVYSVNSLASSGSINFDSQAYYYDLGIIQNRDGSYGATWADRLRGIGAANTSGTVTTNATSLVSSGTAAESTSSNLVQSASGGFTPGSTVTDVVSLPIQGTYYFQAQTGLGGRYSNFSSSSSPGFAWNPNVGFDGGVI